MCAFSLNTANSFSSRHFLWHGSAFFYGIGQGPSCQVLSARLSDARVIIGRVSPPVVAGFGRNAVVVFFGPREQAPPPKASRNFAVRSLKCEVDRERELPSSASRNTISGGLPSRIRSMVEIGDRAASLRFR
jgi:hypothetical protein